MKQALKEHHGVTMNQDRNMPYTYDGDHCVCGRARSPSVSARAVRANVVWRRCPPDIRISCSALPWSDRAHAPFSPEHRKMLKDALKDVRIPKEIDERRN